jgi:hypothetical protein
VSGMGMGFLFPWFSFLNPRIFVSRVVGIV